MAQLLIRGLQPETVELLRELAKANGRTLQQEVKAILEEAAGRYKRGVLDQVSWDKGR